MKFLDLFSGIGGFRLGLEQAGNKCVGHVEIDKFARKSYEEIFDTKGEFEAHDIRTIRASEIPEADIWCFGFPCQDISVAGKQLGFRGNRSSFFFAVTKLIRDLEEENRPSYLFIENVKNLLSINKGFDFAKLLIELDEIGYDAEWDVLDSSEVVPQHRERVFIIGHFRGRRTRKIFPIERSSNQATFKQSQIASTLTTRYGEAQGTGTYIGQNLQAKVKQVGNISNTGSFGGNPQVGRVYSTDGLSPALSTMQGGGREPKILQRSRGNNKGGSHSISPTVSTSSFENNNFLAIKEATKKGFDEAHKGDSVNLSVPNSKTRRGRVGHGKANTLQIGINQGVVSNDLRIRKLTPRECWRLQGFPDWAFDRAEKVNSNSQLYKQAGNSVTVPVIYQIAKKMGYVEVDKNG